MKKTDKSAEYSRRYRKAGELAHEVAQAIADGRTAEDCPPVAGFLRQNKFSKELVSRLSSVEYNQRAYRTMKEHDRETETQRFLERLREHNRMDILRRRRRRVGLSVASAVAVITVIAAFSLFYPGRDAASGSKTGAVSLTLADGSTIALDNSRDVPDFIERPEAMFWNGNGSLTVEKRTEEPGEVQSESYHTLNVSHGYQYDILLEDKTHVWLNSGSSLRFPAVFAGNERKVFVEGEAYFEVAPDSARPFVVETPGQTLTVLGTSFNLYSYRDEPVVYTALLSGSVSVRAGETELVLKPNQISGLNRADSSFSVKNTSAESVSQWRSGAFVFDDNTLEQVLMKVSRWYGVEITYDKEKARAFIYKGNLPRFDTVEEMLESIEMTGLIKFEKRRSGYELKM